MPECLSVLRRGTDRLARRAAGTSAPRRTGRLGRGSPTTGVAAGRCARARRCAVQRPAR